MEKHNMDLQPNDLANLCDSDEVTLRTLGEFQQTDHAGAGFTLLNRGGKVLGIAHIDVHPSIASYHQPMKFDGTKFWHPRLDDRLGLHALLHLLPALEIEVDLMLTENEEIGKSTGGSEEAILAASKYNWMFMMDRRGVDCANYGYDEGTAEWSDALDSHGWDRTHGASSCISKMTRANVKAVNFGVGYTEEHTLECSADAQVFAKQCMRVANFVREFQFHHFLHMAPNYN